MNTLEKAEVTASVNHIVRFSKSEMQIYNSKVQGMAVRKTKRRKRRRRRRRRTHAIADHYAFHTNAVKCFKEFMTKDFGGFIFKNTLQWVRN